MCHGVACFEVLRQEETFGLLGWLYRFEARCRARGWTRTVEPDDDYFELLKEPARTVEETLAATNPDLPSRERRALGSAGAVRERALTPDERHEAIERVFDAGETFSETEKSSKERALSAATRWRYLYLPLLASLLSIPLLLSGWLPEGAAFPALLAFFSLPIVGGLVGWITYPYRFARFVLRPLLLRGLAPIGASGSETEGTAGRRRWGVHGAALRGLAEAIAR